MPPPPPPKLCLQLDPKARPQPQYHPTAFPIASDCPRNRFYSAPQPLCNRSECAPRAPSPSSKPLGVPLPPPGPRFHSEMQSTEGNMDLAHFWYTKLVRKTSGPSTSALGVRWVPLPQRAQLTGHPKFRQSCLWSEEGP